MARKCYKLVGFTLIELLMCIAVIAILATILIVQIPRMRLKSESVITISNMRQIVAAFNLYANEHDGQFPPAQNKSGTDKETWRQRIVFREGYITDYEVFNNPTNRRLRDNKGLGSVSMFVVGADQNTSFSSDVTVDVGWGSGEMVATPVTLFSNLDVPILWDHRADTLWIGNKMTTDDGTPGGYFAYTDGEVRLIGPPSHVIRGEADLN